MVGTAASPSIKTLNGISPGQRDHHADRVLLLAPKLGAPKGWAAAARMWSQWNHRIELEGIFKGYVVQVLCNEWGKASGRAVLVSFLSPGLWFWMCLFVEQATLIMFLL